MLNYLLYVLGKVLLGFGLLFAAIFLVGMGFGVLATVEQRGKAHPFRLDSQDQLERLIGWLLVWTGILLFFILVGGAVT
jgi:hypothetical protein